jgi:hypothetical protein
MVKELPGKYINFLPVDNFTKRQEITGGLRKLHNEKFQD